MGTQDQAQVGRPRTRRLQVRFSPAELELVGERARAASMPMSTAVRQLVHSALDQRATADAAAADQALLTLSGLVAAEHAVRLLEEIVPDGVRRSAALRATSSAAAEARLEELRTQLEETR